MAGSLEDTLSHIKGIIRENRRTETFLLVLVGILFALGVISFALALWRGEYIWSIPSAAASLFLKWPIERVEQMRRRNLALAAAPIFISQLPPLDAAREIQKILESLFAGPPH